MTNTLDATLVNDSRTRVDALMDRAKADLTEVVRFRSQHSRPDLIEECRASATWTAQRFTELGLSVEIVSTVDDSFAVLGSVPAPAGAPTVLLYSHHDIQPAGNESDWDSPPFELTERNGRWYGRGTADCKGSIVAHLTALRALIDSADPSGGPGVDTAAGADTANTNGAAEIGIGIKVVIEGSEENGGLGLETLAQEQPELFDADIILICDTGNTAVGVPTLTTSLRGATNVTVTVRALEAAMHSGQFGGAAPDALAALIAGLASLRNDAGDTVIDGLETNQTWGGAAYPAEQFRSDSTALPGTEILGSGSPADMVWARPAVTVIGIDAPAASEAANAIVATAAAQLNVRYAAPLGPEQVLAALEAHLRAHIPWGVEVSVVAGPSGDAFVAKPAGPGYLALGAAMTAAYERPVEYAGMGGSIPLATILQETHPDAEVALLGICEPQSRIHAANESVDPGEIARTALAEVLLITQLAQRA